MKRPEKFHLMRHLPDGIKLVAALSLLAFVPLAGTSQTGPASKIALAREHWHMSPWAIESSVKLPPQTLNQAITAARKAYSDIISPYAKISIAQATKIAQDNMPNSRISDISLQTIRQNLVYIALLAQDNQRQMVVIDAGNGKVLSTRTIHYQQDQHRHDRLKLNFQGH